LIIGKAKPGPFTGVTEPERLEAVNRPAVGNNINAQADFGDYPMIGRRNTRCCITRSTSTIFSIPASAILVERQHGTNRRGYFRTAFDRSIPGGSRRKWTRN
jgi:hypothetical protein